MPEHDAADDDGAKKNAPADRARKKVGAHIGGAVSKLELATAPPSAKRPSRRRGNRWPAKGMAYDGVMPGAWKEEGPLDETGHLPADCPVRPLGYNGEDYYFVDTKGQVFCSGTNALGVERVQKLFSRNEDFLTWAWPAFGKGKNPKVTGFKAEEVRRDLYAACDARGPWTPTDRVRGRGAWLDRDRGLVLHCGEYLWVTDGKQGGRLEETGELGDHFYVRREASLVPWDQPVDDDINPAVEIFRHLDSWQFERGKVDAMIALGWMGVAMLGAALDWRPSIFVVGDAGTGKSELTGKKGYFRQLLGRSMLSTTNASEAGLYQIVGHDSLPIAIDELEGDDNPEQAQKIIKMARDAASGSVRIRGGSDHKGVEFAAQSTFSFSAINPPGIPPASLSRLAMLQLNPLPPDGQPPKLKAPETVGPRLLRRIADGFSDFPRLYEAYRTVLRANGHNSRGQNTFGTFLAAAHLLLGDAGMEACKLPWENLEWWGEQLSADAVPELENAQPVWLDCIERMMTRQIDKFHGGQRQTVAQVLEALNNNELGLAAATDALAAADIGLLGPENVESGYILAIPNKSDVLAKLMLGTPYSAQGVSQTSWNFALRRGPKEIFITDKERNRVTVAGQQRRCTLVRTGELRRWLQKNG